MYTYKTYIHICTWRKKRLFKTVYMLCHKNAVKIIKHAKNRYIDNIHTSIYKYAVYFISRSLTVIMGINGL